MMSDRLEPNWNESRRASVFHPLAIVAASLAVAAALFLAVDDVVQLGSNVVTLIQLIMGAGLLVVGAIYLQEHLGARSRRRQLDQLINRDLDEIERLRDSINSRLAEEAGPANRGTPVSDNAEGDSRWLDQVILDYDDVMKLVSIIDHKYSIKQSSIKKFKNFIYTSQSLPVNSARIEEFRASADKVQPGGAPLAMLLEALALKSRAAGDLPGAEEALIRALLLGAAAEGLSREDRGSVLAQLSALKQQQGAYQAAAALAGQVSLIFGGRNASHQETVR
jgi:hypothetical protein